MEFVICVKSKEILSSNSHTSLLRLSRQKISGTSVNGVNLPAIDSVEDATIIPVHGETMEVIACRANSGANWDGLPIRINAALEHVAIRESTLFLYQLAFPFNYS